MSQRFCFLRMLAFVGLVAVCASGAWASIVIDTVHVGNPGNAGELSGAGASGYGQDRICGAVDYEYRIGKYEITAGQYTAFLNAVAASDAYGLYDTRMNTAVDPWGCNIIRSSEPGGYTYHVPYDWANRPVAFVSWGSAARFANWLHNGQPTGILTGDPSQDGWLTEDGSYLLNGATSDSALLAIARKADATWVIPTEDEWYKAAYYDPAKPGGAGYWDYPTRSDLPPNNGNPEGDTSNSANFWDGDFTSGAPYYRTPVGFFGQADSAYGTFDQGGNVWEWNEAVIGPYRGLRGGSFSNGDNVSNLRASDRNQYPPAPGYGVTAGFRVAEVGDIDCDGVLNASDQCPDTPLGEETNSQGCACSQINCDDGNPCTSDSCDAGVCSHTPLPDTDNDNACDVVDGCPNDPNKTSPGVCGCGMPDTIEFVGFLPPIGGADATGGSFADPLRAFKLGSTVPVKFQASQCGTPLLTGTHTLQATKYSSSVDSDPPIDATPTEAATTGNQFRLTDGEWHFNISTKTGFSAGTWKLTATLSDGSQHAVWITIKK